MVLSGERAIDATAATQVVRRAPATAVRAARSLEADLAVAPRDRRAARAPHRRLVPLRPDQGSVPGQRDRRRPVRRRHPGRPSRFRDIEEEGLIPQVRRVSNSDVEEGVVFAQNPTEGTRVDKETVVRIDVSSGKPEVTIPSVVGQTAEDAVAELTRAGLVAQVVEVNSDRDEGTVTAQSPSAGTVVVEGTQVRINVSKGPRPVNVPNVVGLPYDQAASELQRAGFVVSRIDEDSDQAAGIVTRQTPSGGSEGSRGSTVTVSVSKGPSTSAVPDVTAQDVAIAQTTLQAAGFRFRVVLRGHGRLRAGRHRERAGSGRRVAGGAQHDRHPLRRPLRRDDTRRPRELTRSRGCARGRPFERARDLARVGALGRGRARSRPLRDGRRRDRQGRPLGARVAVATSFPRRASRRSRSSRTRRRRRRSARSTSCCRSCTARSARTARCRASSSSPACPTSARASPRRRSAWTRTSSRRFSATAGSPSRATSRSAKETSPHTTSTTRCS